MTVAPSVTRVARSRRRGRGRRRRRPGRRGRDAGATVVAPSGGSSRPPASLSSIERKMRKPTTTAISARTIVSGEPTGEPESPTRVESCSLGVGAHAARISRIAHRRVRSLMFSLGVRVPSINVRRRRRRRRWKRRTTSGSWRIAAGMFEHLVELGIVLVGAAAETRPDQLVAALVELPPGPLEIEHVALAVGQLSSAGLGTSIPDQSDRTRPSRGCGRMRRREFAHL